MTRHIHRLLAGILAVVHVSCAAGGLRADAGRPDPLSRIEVLARIVVLEDSRSLGSGALLSFLRHEDPSVRRRAAIAAGRIGDGLATTALVESLKDREVEVRRAAALALGWIGPDEAVDPLRAALADQDPAMRGRAAEALGRIGPKSVGPAIAEAFRRAVPKTPGGVLRIRGDDPGRADDPWIELRLQLIALARLKDADSLAGAVIGSENYPFVDWWVCVWAASQVSDPKLTPILLAGAAAEDPYIRSLAARGLGALKDPTHLGVVRRLAEDRETAVAREALRAAALIGGLEAHAIASLHLDSQNLGLRREALLAVAALPPASALRTRVIENAGHPDPWVRSAAWPALIRIDAEDVGLVLSTIGPDNDWRVRQSVAAALADVLGERAAPLLLPMLVDEDARVISAVLLALSRARGDDAAPTLLDHTSHVDMGVRAAAVLGLSSLPGGGGRQLSDGLSRAFDASLGDSDVETRILIVEAAAKHKGAENLSLLRRIAGSDPARVVRRQALGALGEGTAPPDRSALRIADARRLVSIYEAGGTPFSPRVIVSTRYGTIEMSLDLVDAPLTSMSFVRLAQGGFYNGLTFHRVAPGLVAQGGDPRGDGHGGPGFALRCEYSGRPFGRGAVGMATLGKDSGGSQFFIALDPQPDLDGAYTQFAQVLSGMDVAERIRPGDLIERIDVFDGREQR